MSTTFKKTHIGDVAKINPESLGRNFSFNKIFYIDISTVGTGTADEPQEIELKKAPSRAKRLVKSGDTILSTVRPNRRSFLYIKEPKENLVVSTGFAVVRPEKVNSRYLYYVISDQTFTDYLTRHAKGSAYPAVDAETIEGADFMLPSETEQNAIADILGTYDDLIENNTRRIKVLEQMAQAIYTEWFVNFRFPGHEKVKMIDSGSDFGKIPEGWEISNIGSILDIKSGYSFKSKSYNQAGLFKIVTIKNIHDGKFIDNFNYISDIPEKMPDYCKLMDGDILLSLTGNVGRVCVVYGENLLLNQRVGKIVPNDAEYKSFIYSLFRSDDFKKKLELLSNGVAQQNLSPVQTLDLKIILPPPALIIEYEKVAGYLINLSISLNKQNQNLRQTRDLLLPKLVTGEIKV